MRTGMAVFGNSHVLFPNKDLPCCLGFSGDIAIDVNISFMKAFVAIRCIATPLPLLDTYDVIAHLCKDFEDLKLDIEDILCVHNDINKPTRTKLDTC